MRNSKQNTQRRRRKQALRAARAARLRAERRGILLLVVLSLLVLFLLVGTAFITSSDDYRKASKTLAAPYEPAINPLQQRDLLEVALGQIVRDTNNPHSSIRYHSLLRDLYGSDGILIGPNSPQRVQFVDQSTFPGFQFSAPPSTASAVVLDAELQAKTGNQFFWAAVDFVPADGTLSLQENYYNGRVFTLLDGPAAGRSARVVRYFVDDTNNQALFYLMFTDSDRNFSATELNIQPSHSAVLNGQPFNGTGVGYNSNAPVNSPRLSALERITDINGTMQDYQVALMPNAPFFNPLKLINVTANLYGNNWNGRGGNDESYDAVDFQNMALAWMPVDPIESIMPALDPPGLPPGNYHRNNLPPSLGNMVIPSFHRPALLNYWRANSTNLAGEPNLLRKVLLRPNWHDHPEFDGSNPEFAAAMSDPNDLLLQMIYGPWDVDNDNDSRRDSMWVDIGLPVMMSPQGRLVKPLAAILCVDLDSRLNLNAHGSWERERQMREQIAGLHSGGPPNQTLANGVVSFNLPEGQGYGPAEIDIWPVLQGRLNDSIYIASGSSETLYSRILRGVPALTGSYLDEDGDTFNRPWSGRYGHTTIDPFPGSFQSYDLLAQLKQQGLPRRANANASLLQKQGSYATPPDLMGRYALGLNELGQPVYEVVDDPVDLDFDSPYELNLSRLGPHSAGTDSQDGPFTVGELERILRAYDEDAGKLPRRLWELANNFRPSNTTRLDYAEINEWRGLLTTDSFDLPVPNVTLPEWMRRGPDGNLGTNDDFLAVMGRETNVTFSDLLEYRVRFALGFVTPATITAAQREQIRQVMRQLLAPELADGLRMNLNRPFGNEHDEQDVDPTVLGFGVVDEPGEFDPGTDEERPFWQLDNSRIDAKSAAADTSDFTGRNGSYRDDIDRDGDGDVEPWERGDVDNDGRLSPSELVDLHNYRRQLFARHLYVLAMTLVDPIPIPTTGTNDPKYINAVTHRSRALAQWAINVADFRDSDNIMTAFEYDANPFNGWQVDGNTRDQSDLYGADNKFGGTAANADVGGLVWGAEKPELLITETLAWHDRNTFDSQRESVNSLDEPDDETIGDGIGDVKSGEDMTHDQELRPQGAGFIELYNPWTAETAASADTHLLSNQGVDRGINLAALSAPKLGTNNQNTVSPVWRLSVYRGGGIGLNPDNPDINKRPNHLVWLEKRRGSLRIDQSALPIYKKADRSIYFTNFDPGNRDGDRKPDDSNNDGVPDWDGDDGVAFFSSLPVPPVRPGRYVVVAGVDTEKQATGNAGEYLVPFGLARNRGILLKTELRLAADPNKHAVSLINSQNALVQDVANFAVTSPSEAAANALGLPSVPGFSSTASVAIINRAAQNRFYKQSNIRRFTFSEPAMGYPDRVPLHNSQSIARAVSGWNRNKYVPVMDRPLDERRFYDPDSAIDEPDMQVHTRMRGVLKRQLRAAGNTVTTPTSMNDGEIRLALPEDDKGKRTIPGFSWVYLQRLANPLLAWNPEPLLPNGDPNPKHDPTQPVNPYRTIDVSGVNVTVFNGQSLDERQWPEGEARKEGSGTLRLPKIYSNAQSTATFASLQRGRANDPRANVGNYLVLQDLILRGTPIALQQLADPDTKPEPVLENLWSPEPVDTSTFWRNRGGPSGNGVENQNPNNFFNALPDMTLGFLNERYRDPNSNANAKRILPENPFPWITWNNRPYSSAGELLQVPAHSMFDLPRAFSMVRAQEPREAYRGESTTIRPGLKLDGPFSYLMNFFRGETASDPNSTGVTDPNNPGIPGMYRLVDYVGTSSKYVGTETWLNPREFGENTNVMLASDARFGRQPPFSLISNYRDPGRININTITNPRVWDGGILHRDPNNPNLPLDLDPNSSSYNNYDPNTGHAGPLFIDPITSPTISLSASRRGYIGLNDAILSLDNRYPTFFTNPFRNASAGDLVPATPTSPLSRRDVHATLLRNLIGMDGTDPNNDGVPLFYTSRNSIGSPNTTNDDRPRLASIDTERNPYFRYQSISRLQNLTTTHSNVYAVWITIGFFEVEPAPPYAGNEANFGNDINVYNRVYPEGYQFGREVEGSGRQPHRLRMFAIVDRSVPVAFEPGNDHNVERAIRLRRRIE